MVKKKKSLSGVPNPEAVKAAKAALAELKKNGTAEPTQEAKPEKPVKPKKIGWKEIHKRSPEVEALAAQRKTRTYEQWRFGLRQKARAFYDLQALQIQTGGRVTPKASGNEVVLAEYDRAVLASRAFELDTAKQLAFRDVVEHLQDDIDVNGKPVNLYQAVFGDRERFKGVAETMGAVIFSEFDIHKAPTISQFWSFCGLAPLPAFRCKKCNTLADEIDREDEDDPILYKHGKGITLRKPQPDGTVIVTEDVVKCPFASGDLQEDQVYLSGKSARPVAGLLQASGKPGLPFSTRMRSKMVGVLGTNLLMCENTFYRPVFEAARKRWQDAGKGRSDDHRKRHAIRVMTKALIGDVWERWRKAMELPIRPPYAEEKLGIFHHPKLNPLKT